MKLTKNDIAGLQISDELKADLTGLFSLIETKESEVENLRKKVPTDSQRVVESVDYDKFTKATQELADLKATMQAKLESEKGGEHFLSMFSAFFDGES